MSGDEHRHWLVRANAAQALEAIGDAASRPDLKPKVNAFVEPFQSFIIVSSQIGAYSDTVQRIDQIKRITQSLPNSKRLPIMMLSPTDISLLF